MDALELGIGAGLRELHLEGERRCRALQGRQPADAAEQADRETQTQTEMQTQTQGNDCPPSVLSVVGCSPVLFLLCLLRLRERFVDTGDRCLAAMAVRLGAAYHSHHHLRASGGSEDRKERLHASESQEMSIAPLVSTGEEGGAGAAPLLSGPLTARCARRLLSVRARSMCWGSGAVYGRQSMEPPCRWSSSVDVSSAAVRSCHRPAPTQLSARSSHAERPSVPSSLCLCSAGAAGSRVCCG